MRLICVFLIALVSMNVGLANAKQANLNSPIGTWKTIDDVTGVQKSIIRITENSDHTLSGQIIKTFPTPGEPLHRICDACKDEKHNQLILGMVILTGLKQENGEQWDGGKILDPLNGKYYSCSMRVMDGGEKLKVRGYIGFSLLGRSQVWLRVPKN